MLTWLKTKLWPRLRKTSTRWQDDDGELLAASVAYYAAFSIFPLLLILISALGFALRFSSNARDAQQQLLEMIQRQTSETLAIQVEQALAEVREKAVVSGPLGLATLLVGAIGIFVHLEKAFNRIWDVDNSRSKGLIAGVRKVLIHRARAFLMLLGLGVLVLAAFVAGITASAIQPFAAEAPGGWWAWKTLQTLLSLILNWLLFTTIYKVLPKPHVRWSEAMRGGVLAALAWEFCRQVLAFFVVGRNYSAYGVVGALIVVMLWIYIGVNVLLLGAEYVRVIREESDEKAGS